MQLPIPAELKDVLVDGWEGTLELEAEVDAVSGGQISLAITGVYPGDGEQDYGPLIDDEEAAIEESMPPEPFE